MREVLKYLQSQDNYVLFSRGKRYFCLFTQPEKIIVATTSPQIFPALIQIEKYLSAGKYLAGFFSYELGYFLEKKISPPKSDFPYLWFGVYRQQFVWDIIRHRFISEPANWQKLSDISLPEYALGGFSSEINYPEYSQKVLQIKDFIRQGDVYQVNLTFKKKFDFYGSPLSLFEKLVKNQPTLYSGIIRYGNTWILSCSPELFFCRRGNTLTMQPMKGTSVQDNPEQLQNWKNRSENLMIVDLLRNDLGKIARKVFVPKLFTIEKYPTLNQMTSTVKARISPAVAPKEIIRALFPSGSVTGAPKLAAMEIIRKLEKSPRRIYTGALGYFSPDKKDNFNVSIRTILLDEKKHRGEMGIGSGIVIDSNPRQEYQECQLKSRFLEMTRKDFQLIETLLYCSQAGFWLEKYHWQRLKHSAEVFRFPLKYSAWEKALKSLKEQFLPGRKYRCRLLLSPDGKITSFAAELRKISPVWLVKISSVQRFSGDFFLQHKTTLRQVYEEEYQKCRKEGFSEVIFTNENGEITEGSRTNIFVRKGKLFFTPPVECGLLPGTLRRYLREKYPQVFREKIIKIPDLLSADEIFLGNSVIGLKLGTVLNS